MNKELAGQAVKEKAEGSAAPSAISEAVLEIAVSGRDPAGTAALDQTSDETAPYGEAAENPDPTPAPDAAQKSDGTGESAPIQVDFASLQRQCPDVIGWLYCPYTPINCPVVWGSDNSYYLNHLPDGSKNNNGSLFADYREAGDFSGWNTVIYGHNMKSGAMFGSLKEYRAQEYFDAHPVLYLLTPEKSYKVVLFAGAEVNLASPVYRFPAEKEDRDRAVESCLAASTFVSGVTSGSDSRILTLSTCINGKEDVRYVLLGELQELE